MTRLKPVLPVFCIAIALLISGCTPDGAKAVAREVYGLELSDTQAKAVAEHHAQPKASPAPQGQLVSVHASLPAGTTAAGWARLRNCESGGRYGITNRSGKYMGAYQFDQGTWNGIARRINGAYVGVRPHHAPPAVQDAMAYQLWRDRGRYPWPHCGRKM